MHKSSSDRHTNGIAVSSGLPENYSLTEIEWQIFGTLTFSDYLPESTRISMFFILMREFAASSDVHWKKLLWVLKQEYGYGVDIPHFHFLVAVTPQQAICVKSCRQLREMWKRKGGGLAQIELYNPELNGRDYVLKCSGEKSGNTRVESGNLEDNRGLMLSNSTLAYLKRRS